MIEHGPGAQRTARRWAGPPACPASHPETAFRFLAPDSGLPRPNHSALAVFLAGVFGSA